MNTIVPLISSGEAGPLGVLHLPRLWLKVSLYTQGKLAPGYNGDCTKGYDSMVLEALGIDRNAFLDFIKKDRPTYPQLETWILKQKGGKLDQKAVEKLNASIRNYNHVDETRKAILSANGIPDDGKIKDAVNLNNLDDWKEFHAAVLK